MAAATRDDQARATLQLMAQVWFRLAQKEEDAQDDTRRRAPSITSPYLHPDRDNETPGSAGAP
jgi:hypothetical protein